MHSLQAERLISQLFEYHLPLKENTFTLPKGHQPQTYDGTFRSFKKDYINAKRGICRHDTVICSSRSTRLRCECGEMSQINIMLDISITPWVP